MRRSWRPFAIRFCAGRLLLEKEISGARRQNFVPRLLDSRERCTQIGIITRRALFDFGQRGKSDGGV